MKGRSVRARANLEWYFKRGKRASQIAGETWLSIDIMGLVVIFGRSKVDPEFVGGRHVSRRHFAKLKPYMDDNSVLFNPEEYDYVVVRRQVSE